MSEGGAKPAVRQLLLGQRESTRQLLALRYPLDARRASTKGFDSARLCRNPYLPWRELLREAPSFVDWKLLSENQGGFWDEELVERHSRRLDFARLSANPSVPWTSELLVRFRKRWSWRELSMNPGLPWDASFLERHRSNWEWSRLAANPGIAWSRDWVERFGSELDAPDREYVPYERPRQIAPGVTLCESGWHHLQQNRSVAWEDVLPVLQEPVWSLLSRNPALPWSAEFIERHEHDIDWGRLAVNPSAPWRIDLIDAHADQIEWLHLAGNPSLPWSDDLLERFEPHADSVWRRLSANSGAAWSNPQLERHRHRLEWGARGISRFGAMADPVVERWADWLDFQAGVPRNERLAWSAELVHRWSDRWGWACLGENPALPWSDSLLAGFADHWQIASFEHNDAAWRALADLLDDDLLSDVLAS